MKKRVLDYVLTYISVNMKKYNFKTKVSYKKMKKFELRYEKKNTNAILSQLISRSSPEKVVLEVTIHHTPHITLSVSRNKVTSWLC